MNRVWRTLPPLALLACAGATAARADYRAWWLCTPGAVRSCHSISIGTAPIFTGTVRTGTAITISITNLQGSGVPNTGSQPTGLYQLYFTGPVSTPVPVSVSRQNAAMTGTGASGSLNWEQITTTAVVGGTNYAWVELRGTGASPPLLGGCSSGPVVTGTIAARTCGLQAAAVFAFSVAGSLDASQLNDVFVHAYAANGSSACYADPAAAPFPGQACESIPAVPEPGTIVLLGTGLMGLGGMGLRRRRAAKPQGPDRN